MSHGTLLVDGNKSQHRFAAVQNIGLDGLSSGAGIVLLCTSTTL
ncbi:hypothetical protein [Pectobacterium versatile]|nr:hypothetical protein [Pectobacterium versatile]